jgi:membrane peptidoglycan carboxypeptidase
MSTSVAHIIRRRRSRKQYRRQRNEKNRLWGGLIGGLLLLTVGVPVLGALLAGGFLYVRTAALLPTPAQSIYQDAATGTTQLYDRTGQTLLFDVSDPLGDQRAWVSLDSLPRYVAQATLLMEDPDFLDTTRWDALETLADVWQYILWGAPSTANSLTARLVNNTLAPLAGSDDLDPALVRMVFISEVNRRYSPSSVLEWVLNTAYYGSDAYGIEAAAQVYLGKSARDLTLDEAALLVPIALEPRYNPFSNEAAARGRQGDLLRAMLVRDLISQPDFEAAASRLTPFNPQTLQQPYIAPEFSVYARAQAQDILTYNGLDGARLVSKGGLRIITTLDLPLYYQSECLLRAHLAQLGGASPTSTLTLTGEACAAVAGLPSVVGVNTASLPDRGELVTLDVASGELLSVVGDVSSYRHQPAGTLFPFVYLEGFRSGDFTPATMVYDIPQPFPGPSEGLIYQPVNPDGQYRGPLNLRAAMAGGLLPPAVGVADSRGINRVLNSAHIIGINSLAEGTYDLSLLERGGQVSVLDMAYAYSVFANMGYMQGVDTEPLQASFRARNPVAILRIEDAAGKVLWEYDSARRQLSRTNILGEDFSYMINHILADASARQRVLNADDSALNIGRPVSVLNALSSDRVDDWTIGYTPQLLTAVRLGRADDAPMTLKTGAFEGAATLWQAVMRYAHDRSGLPIQEWQQPANIAQYRVCERSGMIPRPEVQCPSYVEIFLRQVPPYQTDNFWQSIAINSETLQRATAYTPVNLQVQRIYFIPPQVAMDWWRSNNMPLPPQEYDTVSRPDLLKAVEIFVPADFAYVGGVVDVRGSVDTTAQSVREVQLSYGAGLNPSRWFNIGDALTTYAPGTSLGLWDTAGLDGIHTLQMLVTFSDGTRDTDFVQVTVDNIAPTIALQAGEPNQLFRYPADRAIPIVANVSDNLAINRVEFYHNGRLIATDSEWPYGFEFPISQPATEQFSATVFDQVGNTAEAQIQVEIIRN